MEQVFLLVLQFSIVSIIVLVLNAVLACCFYQKDKRAEPGNFPRSNGFSITGDVK
jgi:hypothetical protein